MLGEDQRGLAAESDRRAAAGKDLGRRQEIRQIGAFEWRFAVGFGGVGPCGGISSSGGSGRHRIERLKVHDSSVTA